MSKERQKFKVALAGNPNCGKTTLFNELTGSCHQVGNRIGVTVECMEGMCRNEYCRNSCHIQIADLPGIYSLYPYSAEEVITRDYILNDEPDVILNIVDAANLERNLYLTLQLSECGVPVVIALNMIDVIEREGGKIDTQKLGEALGIPVFPISASKGIGIHELMAELTVIAGEKTACRYKVKCGEDEDTAASRRYAFIRKAVSECMKRNKTSRQEEITGKIDNVMTHPLAAIPLFLLIMFFIFQITFGAFGTYLSGWVDYLFNVRFAAVAENMLMNLGVNEFLKGLITDGIIAGTGGVVTFFPQIMLLFLFLSFLEDSGYMARVSFIMDKLFMKFGLSGKSFVPMIIGFGCTVPAVMAARTLSSEHDRRLTILIMPFMSCGAKMPVYAMIASAVFSHYAGFVVMGLYVLGCVFGIISCIIFSKTILKGSKPPFVLELPPYRMPTLKSTFYHMWEKAKDFMIRAGTVLFTGSVVIWLMHSLGMDFRPIGEEGKSIIMIIGEKIAPLFSVCGFGTPEAAVSLISGIAAKESIISTMSILYDVKDTAALTVELAKVFTPLSACSYLIFILLYTPCIAAVSAIKTELNSLRLTVFSVVYQLSVAWAVSALVFLIGDKL